MEYAGLVGCNDVEFVTCTCKTKICIPRLDT